MNPGQQGSRANPAQGGRAASPLPVSMDDIVAAAARLKGKVSYTPCARSIPLSEATGCEIFCKLEYLQRTGSFKERGARNALEQLDAKRRRAGVVAASAGNHALGLVYHASLLNIPVTVVMPETAPLTKVSSCRKMGANVLLFGNGLAEARERADKIVEAEGLTYIHGYDDLAVIAGQGTMGLEILEQVPDVEAIIIPIGGGGLIAGIALAVKTLRPEVQIIGVEPRRAASFTAALRERVPSSVEIRPTLADGLAVASVGPNAFAIAREFVDRVVVTSEHHIALAILRLVELEKAVVEGAGAAPLAALLEGLLPELKGKRIVLPLCGGNIDTNVLGKIIERGLVADGRLFRFSAHISDRPGGLARFAAVVAEEGASIFEIDHDRAFGREDIQTVIIHCIVEARDFAHIDQLKRRLVKERYVVDFDA